MMRHSRLLIGCHCVILASDWLTPITILGPRPGHWGSSWLCLIVVMNYWVGVIIPLGVSPHIWSLYSSLTTEHTIKCCKINEHRLLSAKVSGVIGPFVINTNESNPSSRVLAAAKISRRRSHKFLPQYKRLNRDWDCCWMMKMVQLQS